MFLVRCLISLSMVLAHDCAPVNSYILLSSLSTFDDNCSQLLVLPLLHSLDKSEYETLVFKGESCKYVSPVH